MEDISDNLYCIQADNSSDNSDNSDNSGDNSSKNNNKYICDSDNDEYSYESYMLPLDDDVKSLTVEEMIKLGLPQSMIMEKIYNKRDEEENVNEFEKTGPIEETDTGETDTEESREKHTDMNTDMNTDANTDANTDMNMNIDSYVSKYRMYERHNDTREMNELLNDEMRKGIVGIQNLGNTCYANSVIQLMRNVPEFINFFSENSSIQIKEMCQVKDTENQIKILMGYDDLVKTMENAKYPAFVRPLGFMMIIRSAVQGTVYEQFAMNLPNDSHEYLVYLLDNFHEALNTGDKTKMINIVSDDGNNAWNNFKRYNNSFIFDTCFGMFRKIIECSHCKNKSFSWETFNVFKVIPEGQTLEDWIESECQESIIEDFHCSNCSVSEGKRHPAILFTHLWQLPLNLFLAIKRFTPQGTKIMKPVIYNNMPLIFTRWFANESKHPSKNYKYICSAICDHHGSHMGGHYSAQIYNPVGNKWWIMDDEHGQIINGPMFSQSNYIMYFRGV